MKDKLTVTINSFSYKRSLPEDKTGNGGGFVFDCRAVHNPGRYEEYQSLTGKDQQVIDFFEKKTEMHQFLEHVFSLVEISIKKYLERNFTHLMVSFGCTGGQHRSVYCAEKLAYFLQNKFNIHIQVHHIEQELIQKESQ
jgi:RNase adaptor protein for sRNA GlmZ degradation